MLTLPIRLVTRGLFTVAVNSLMLMLTAWLVDVPAFDGRFFYQLLAAVVASI